MKYSFLCLLLFVSFLSCGNEEESPIIEAEVSEVEFIIGITFGECGGDCAHLFEYKENEIFPDDEPGHWWGDEEPEFKDDPIDNPTAVAQLQTLIEDFPQFLLDSSESSFGCPDCGDWGAIHIMLALNDDEERWWVIDNNIENNPEEIQDWARRVQNLLDELMN